MDDAAYTFMQTSKDRKSLARNAKYKRNGVRSKKCTLPSDYLTPSQKKGLNGTMQTYDMNKPHTLNALKDWPDDIRHEYMKKLIDTYMPPNSELADMLGISAQSVAYTLGKYFGINRDRRYKPSKNVTTRCKWACFCEGTSYEEHEKFKEQMARDLGLVKPEAEPEPEPLPEVHSWPGTITNPSGTVLYETITVQFTGTADDLIRVIQTGPIHLTGADTYTFTIRAARKEA